MYELTERYVPQKKRKIKQKCCVVKQEGKKGDQKEKQKVEIVQANATEKDIDYRKYKECFNLVES